MSDITCHDCGHAATENAEILQRDYGWQYIFDIDCWLCRSCYAEREALHDE